MDADLGDWDYSNDRYRVVVADLGVGSRRYSRTVVAPVDRMAVAIVTLMFQEGTRSLFLL